MRKGSLNSPTTPIQGSRNMPSATKGMSQMGGLMGGSDAGVAIKQIEGVSVGSPNLKTPTTSVLGGSKTPASAGAAIGKTNLITPTKDVVK